MCLASLSLQLTKQIKWFALFFLYFVCMQFTQMNSCQSGRQRSPVCKVHLSDAWWFILLAFAWVLTITCHHSIIQANMWLLFVPFYLATFDKNIAILMIFSLLSSLQRKVKMRGDSTTHAHLCALYSFSFLSALFSSFFLSPFSYTFSMESLQLRLSHLTFC